MDYHTIRIYSLNFIKTTQKTLQIKAVNQKNPTLSGRQLLTRAPQALGLLRARSGHKLMISKAGEALIDDDLYEDTILHQMLKFQLPSPLHHEKKGYNKGLCHKNKQ